ncbi:DUF4149 domain-containing protein [Chitiniphilus purpureus]|uniref:DUF4149 domain-containing protein n=1 Tax=Chitiniphilus purpureus TaxID=2981137 RepID=A0ABY6DKD7_9NEIS|nr:DUF4149 domain-containing protein [Chitiniphilus sp. CD1]UXY14820.1 DUF4149 domain-containing protein [Chitiniphilus sp. CD1]
MANGLKSLLTVLWIGGLWIVGVLVAPILFKSLDARLAGNVAGQIFRGIGWLGIVAGAYLLVYWLWAEGLRAFKEAKLWLVIGMLVCTLINQFAVFPIIAGIKPGLSQAATGVFGGGLEQWHTISSLIYLVQALFGAFYVWRDAR